jgi:hypothetical protein
MIISDLSYLEVTGTANKVEGGIDFGFSGSFYAMRLAQVGTASASGPGGSVASSYGVNMAVLTGGITGVVLGLP